MKRTIGFYDDSERRGGTSRYLSYLLSGIDRQEFDLVFFAPYARPWHKELVDAGVEVHTLFPEPAASPVAVSGNGSSPAYATQPSPRKPRLRLPPAAAWTLGTLREIVRLRRLFRKRHVDLLHSNNAGAEPAPIAARLARVPRVLATLHVDSTYDLEGVRGGTRYRLLEKACMRSLHHAISVSRATAADWIRRCDLGEQYWRRVTVIHNGVPTGQLRRRRSLEHAKRDAGLSDRLVVGSAGRLEAAKGYEYLIRALPGLVHARPDVLVRIAGHGELQESLTDQAHALGVENHLDFAGFVQDIPGFLESIDMYVQPSLCEALPFAVLEAAALGMPIVASNVGGVAECVHDGKTGFVVPARDPRALGDAILRLAANDDLRSRMSAEAARVALESFDASKMADETVKLYRKLLAS